MKQPPRKPPPPMLNAPAQNPKETTFILTLSDWDRLRLTIAVRELRLRSRMSVADIAKAMRATPDEVRDCLRRPGSTQVELLMSELTVRVLVTERPKYRTGLSTVLVRVKRVLFPATTDSSR